MPEKTCKRMSEGVMGKEKARIDWEWMLEHPERECVCTDGTACYCYDDEGGRS